MFRRFLSPLFARNASPGEILGSNVPLLVIGMLLIDSLFFIFVALLEPYFPPLVASFWVMAIAAVQLTAYAIWRKQFHWRTFAENWAYFLTIGFLVAAATGLSYAAVIFIDPGTAALLAQSSILFGLLLGIFWLREKFSVKQTIGAVLALIGLVIVTFQPGDFLRIGAILVVLGALAYAVHAAVYKQYGGRLGFTEFFAWRLICSAGFLGLFAAIDGQSFFPPQAVPAAWLLVLFVATIDVTVSRALYYVALRKLPISLHSLILTLSPVATVLWALLLFGTVPGPNEIIGGAVIVVGIGIITFPSR